VTQADPHGFSGSLKCVVLLLLCLLLTTPIALAVDFDQKVVTLDIAGGTPIERALLDLARSANMLFSASAASLSGHQAPALKGAFSLSQALANLLQGSGLTYKVVDNTLYVVRTPAESTVKRPFARESDAAGIPAAPRQAAERSSRALGRHEGRAKPGSSDDEMPEVTIATGSHIPGKGLVSSTIVFDRRYLDATGFQTVGDALRSLPQSFPGGLNPAVFASGGSQNSTSLSAASSANLRGLGSSSTLTLINGHRVATAEGSGAVDVTLIPISAVERIEVITDGASAVYGSDAVAGVVNIILRDSYEGVELSAAEGGATEGGGILQHYSLVGGHSWSDANVLGLEDCAWQSAVTSAQRSYLPLTLSNTTLLPRTQNCTTLFSTTRDLPGDVEAKVLGVYTTRSSYRAETLNSISAGLEESSIADVGQYALDATVTAPLAGDWTGVFSADLSADNVNSPEALTIGAIPYIQSGERFDNRMRSVEAYAAGTLLQLPGGAVRLAVGAGYRDEGFSFAALPEGDISISRSRGISSVFAEAAVPMISPNSGAEDPSALTLNLAARVEHYTDVGTTANPRISLLYTPAPGFKASASWGTSFRAPSLSQQYNSSGATLQFVPDPTAASGESLALIRSGGNSQLKPEKSSDFSVGVTFTPGVLPDASLQVSYFDIRYTQRIEFPALNIEDALLDSGTSPFIMRNPSAADIAQILAQSPFQNLTAGRYPVTEATVLIDDRDQNIAQQRASGVDLLSRYLLEAPIGRLRGSLNLAYLQLQQRATPESAVSQLSGTVFNPPTLRSRAGVTWDSGGYSGSLFVNYTGPSLNSVSLPEQRVASWTTLDGQIGYVFGGMGLRGNTQLALTVQNLLDRRPPFVNASELGSVSLGFDPTNASAMGRFLTFQATMHW
jgi:iron complex outermembrane receptor protein